MNWNLSIMQEVNSRPVIAIYTQRYLNKSMTFVYRQLLSVSQEFEAIVLTSNEINNRDIFPFEKIFSKSITPLGRLFRVYKKLTGHFAILSPMQKKYFYNILKKNNVKLVHAHFGPSAIEIYPVAKRLNVPLIVSFYGYDASQLLSNKKYLNDLKKIFEYALILAMSNYMFEKLKMLNPKRENIYKLYLGIDLSKFPLIERKPLVKKYHDGEEIICLQISNFVEKKGHKYTIKAFSELLKEYNRCKLILGGAGKMLSEIKILTSKLGISDKVEFINNVNPEDLFTFMKKADLFFHHSVTSSKGDQEGIPTVITEAMATGLPVISTYHAGIPELIQDGVNGFLVKEKDIDGYINIMIKALSTDQEISHNAFNKVKLEFNLELQSKKLVELYKKIMENH